MKPAPVKTSRLLVHFITAWVILHFFFYALVLFGFLLEYDPGGLLVFFGLIPFVLALLASVGLVRKISGARAMATFALGFTALNGANLVFMNFVSPDGPMLNAWMAVLALAVVAFNVYCIRFFWWNKNGNPYRRREGPDASTLPVEDIFE
jgi:O-antigen/teichoic acid export membrane protein